MLQNHSSTDDLGDAESVPKGYMLLVLRAVQYEEMQSKEKRTAAPR